MEETKAREHNHLLTLTFVERLKNWTTGTAQPHSQPRHPLATCIAPGALSTAVEQDELEF